MSDPETYEVYAIRFGRFEQRLRRDNFTVPPDAHDGPMPIHYFVWAIVNANRTIVVDTGFDHAESGPRQRPLDRLPREGLAMIGVDAAKVENVIITHLHYDHAGTFDHFPAARFHVQELEMNYATGRHMCQASFRHAYTCDHVVGLVRRVFDGRVTFHDGDSEIAPGITVHHVGGHTMGMQCVRVFTKRGWIVLASDAAHFYENMNMGAPFPIVYSVADMLDGHARMKRLAVTPNHVIPGHDPLVMKYYPTPKKALEGVVVRLDVDPKM
jgi:glyoxylase-like metal-dependent hydrolase (beta-lactamase superfamily II)